MKKIRKRLTYANVMSSIAVFMVLGGGAALAALGKNSVGTKQLKPNAVTKKKLKKNSVTTPKIVGQAVTAGKLANGAVFTDKIADLGVTTGKIANDAVTTDKIAADAVTLAKLAADSVNSAKVAPNSLTAADLAPASVGSSELGAITIVTANSATVADGATAGVTATCPAGTRAISGGFDGGNNATPWRVQRLVRDGNGWRAFGTNQTGSDSFLQAEATCLAP